MFSSKKGIAMNLFKWIFALVAGAIILVFFIGLAFQQERTGSSIDERRLVIGIDHQLSALSTGEAASKTLPLKQEKALRFDCDGISVDKYRRSTEKIIFAPPLVEGNVLHTWTQQWKFPFRAGNFYYLANQQNRALLVYDAQSIDFVTNLNLPRTFNIQLIDIQSFKSQQLLGSVRGLDQFNLIFFTPIRDVQTLLQDFQGTNTNIAEVNVITHDVQIHNGVTVEDTFYLGESMLLGLFFAPEQYTCIKDKALTHYRHLLSLYEQKIQLLLPKLSVKPICQGYFEEAKKILVTLQTIKDNTLFYELTTALAQQNRNLEKNDCPTIY